jgi:xylulokinase
MKFLGIDAVAGPSVDAACDTVVRIASTVEPNNESIKILDQQYEKFRRVYPALKG